MSFTGPLQPVVSVLSKSFGSMSYVWDFGKVLKSLRPSGATPRTLVFFFLQFVLQVLQRLFDVVDRTGVLQTWRCYIKWAKRVVFTSVTMFFTGF